MFAVTTCETKSHKNNGDFNARDAKAMKTQRANEGRVKRDTGNKVT